METSEQREQEKKPLSDNDLNAVEAWMLCSSHDINAPDGNKVFLSDKNIPQFLKTDRRLVLTPDNILKGVYTREHEDARRRSKPYEDGVLSLFGPAYVISGHSHKIYLGSLDENGMASSASIELYKNGQVVDPQTLSLVMDSSYENLFEQPEFVDGRINLHVKGSQK